MEERILIAGAGGQGALTIGKFLASVAMEQHRVTFFPSYGAEVRGGTAHCHVVISEDEIANPVVDEATLMIVMNHLSYRRFAGSVRPDGLLLLNGSMVQQDPPAVCGRAVSVPATELASEMGNIRVANMILLGVMNAVHPLLEEKAVDATMRKILGSDPSKARILDLNRQAYKVGLNQGRKLA